MSEKVLENHETTLVESLVLMNKVDYYELTGVTVIVYVISI